MQILTQQAGCEAWDSVDVGNPRTTLWVVSLEHRFTQQRQGQPIEDLHHNGHDEHIASYLYSHLG